MKKSELKTIHNLNKTYTNSRFFWAAKRHYYQHVTNTGKRIQGIATNQVRTILGGNALEGSVKKDWIFMILLE